MKIPTQLRSGNLGVNMTPMIDVVFLLIIFFLVSTHLRKQEERKIDLSKAQEGQPLSGQVLPNEVVINVLTDGEIFLASNRVTVEQLPQRLQQKKKSDEAELTVRIRCDRKVPYRTVAPILLACAKSDVQSVKISVFHKSGGP